MLLPHQPNGDPTGEFFDRAGVAFAACVLALVRRLLVRGVPGFVHLLGPDPDWLDGGVFGGAFDDPDALSLGFGQPCRREVGAWLRSFEARVEARFNALALTGWALASPVVAPHGCGRSLLSSVVDMVIPEPGDAGALDEDADLRERVVGYWSKMTGIDRQFAGVLGAPSTATKICALRTSPVVGSTMDTLCPA